MSASLVRRIGPKPLFALALIGVIGSASLASSADKPALAKPKLREVADLPEDYLGQTFTFTVRISSSSAGMAFPGNNASESSSCGTIDETAQPKKSGELT